MKFEVKAAVHDLGEDLYSLIVECFDERAIEFFEEQGYEGNGYTWHAIVDALSRTRFGARHGTLSFSPEAESLMVTSADRDLLTELEAAVSGHASSAEAIQGLLGQADSRLLE